MMLLISMSISFIILTISLFIDFKKKFNKNKSSLFECGFDSINITRSPFSLHFFKLCLIFIIFDIEIIIILPSPMIIYNNFYFFFMFSIIVLIFFLSLIFEWNQNSLNWMK